jgi:hypothetical protein
VWLAQPLGIVERLLGVLIPRGCSVLERLLRLEGPKPDVPQNWSLENRARRAAGQITGLSSGP